MIDLHEAGVGTKSLEDGGNIKFLPYKFQLAGIIFEFRNRVATRPGIQPDLTWGASGYPGLQWIYIFHLLRG
jgi:hypothetical protein